MIRRLSFLLVTFLLVGLVLPFIPQPVSAMTGSGTPGDPYVIYDVDDLQDMENDLDAYYELADDIDASATSGWNGGKGFAPIGSGQYNEDHTWTDPILITSDHSSGGSWVLGPAGGTLTSKLLTNDGGTSYISTTTTNSWALFNLAEAIDLHPSASYIYVFFQMDCRRMSSSYSYIYPYMRIGGVNYVGYDSNIPTNGEYLGTYYCSRAWETTNPATGNPWTPAEVESIEAFGFIVTDASPEVRITRFSVCVRYSLVFTGSFDGNSYTISDLYVNWVPSTSFEPYQAAGLFGQADDATFRDVTISDATVNGGYYAGILVGECWNNAGNVTVEDVHVSGDIEGWGTLGGLAGKLGYWADDGESVTITDCSSSGTVSTAFDESGEYVGGLIGEIAYGTVTDCSSSCDIEAWWTTVIGGLIGECDYSDLLHCYATGDILAVNLADGAGGLIGYFGGYDGVWSTITECFSTGDVLVVPNGAYPCDTTFYVGGLVGDSFCLNVSNSYSRGDVTTNCTTGCLGGFLGYADGWSGENATSTNCYATGFVSGNVTYKGGFIGYIDAYVVNTACFWDEDTSGLSDGVGFGSEDGITGASTTEMNTRSTFESYGGWDFSTPIWVISSVCNDGYPYLCSFCYLDFICLGGCGPFILYLSSTLGGNVTTPGEGPFLYDGGTIVSLNVTAESNYVFYRWTGEVGLIGDAYDGSTNITMEDDYIIIANFQSTDLLPMPVIPIITPEEEEADPSILPWYDLIHPAAVGLGWRTIDFWSILIIFIAIAMGVGVMIATGSTLLAAITVSIVLVVGVSMSILSLWVVIVYAIFAGSYLVAVRAM